MLTCLTHYCLTSTPYIYSCKNLSFTNAPAYHSGSYESSSPLLKSSKAHSRRAFYHKSPCLLVFQEAKSSCAGQWYLPAGRMEPGEDIIEAAKREVLEETGIHFEPSTMLLVESAGTFPNA